MKRATAWNATSVLCALWLGACASTVPSAGKTAAAAPENAPQASPAPDASADVETIAKNLPGTLDGEIRRAQLLRSKGDLDDAGQALAQLMLVAPDDPRVIGEYGKVLAQQGQSKAAIPFLKRATELEPKDWTVYSALGVAYDQNDDHPHARLAYEHALELAPGEPTVLNNYAVSRMLDGDLPGAQRLLARASASDSTANPKIANNVQMLATLKGPAPTVSAPQKTASAKPQTEPNIKIASREAVAPPQPVVSAVVMQTVPLDPLAGPVKSKTATHARLAGTAKPKQVAPVSPPPALRTAADAN